MYVSTGWMASPTRWTWVWVNSRSWWWTGRPGTLRFMGSQRVRHDWATELNWTQGTGCTQSSWKVWRRAGQGQQQLLSLLVALETGSFRDYRKRLAMMSSASSTHWGGWFKGKCLGSNTISDICWTPHICSLLTEEQRHNFYFSSPFQVPCNYLWLSASD